MKRKTALAMVVVSIGACGPREEAAERVLRGGAVYTVDDERSWASALAIANGRIVYVGDDQGVEAYVGPETEVLDLNGKMVLPGFFDSHSHPSGALVRAVSVYLYDLGSLEAYTEAIREYAERHPDKEAIRGGGWSNTLFPETGPRKEALDAVVPDRPVQLISEDGHSSWVNSKALELAGITSETPDPEGGVIERDPTTGEPLGTLRESASRLVARVLPSYTVEERVAGLEAFQKMAAREGVTSVRIGAIGIDDASMTVDENAVEAYARLEDEGRLTVRFRGSLLFPPEAELDRIPSYVAKREEHAGGLFEIDAVKIFVDGVVEGETAYLLEPYAHRPDYRGELLWDPERLETVVAALDEEGFIVHVHAIGDAATRVALDAFEHARAVNGPRDARHQITHLQLVSPEDIERFAELGVVGVPQPFWFSKGSYYESIEVPYLGEERASREYPMQSFLEAGVTMASASDFPVTIPFSPLAGIERGVRRTYAGDDPEQVLGPEERASLEEMIASFTVNGAYAAFLEEQTGSLELGKRADVVVLDRNLFEIPEDGIDEARVLLTLFGGKEVFRAPEL